MVRWSCRAAMVLLVACGVTDPSSTTLEVSGGVVSKATAAPIVGATVFFMFQPPYSSWKSAYALTQATTDASGRYRMEIGPPPGYAYPNCVTLHLEASAPGFQRGWASVSGGLSCSGSIEQAPIQLDPISGGLAQADAEL